MKKILLILAILSYANAEYDVSLVKECRGNIGYWVKQFSGKQGLVSESSSIIIDAKTLSYEFCRIEDNKKDYLLFKINKPIYIKLTKEEFDKLESK